MEYVFITSYEITSKYMTNRTAKATAIFEDGTTKDIEVNLKKSDDDVVKDWTNRKDGKTNENRWYQYTGEEPLRADSGCHSDPRHRHR